MGYNRVGAAYGYDERSWSEWYYDADSFGNALRRGESFRACGFDYSRDGGYASGCDGGWDYGESGRERIWSDDWAGAYGDYSGASEWERVAGE